MEGEKAAQALIDQGICTTTAMNGASAPVDKTDWSPLKNKQVTIWPDNDEAGRAYAEKAAVAIADAGAVSVCIVRPPQDKPEKWDGADAVEEGFENQAVAGYRREKNLSASRCVPSVWESCWTTRHRCRMT